MRAILHNLDLLNPGEVSLIHQGALRILDEMGMEIQNQRLLQVCAEAGLAVDFSAQRARLPASLVERFIAEADKFNWVHLEPQVTSTAGVYHSLYHDPISGQLVPWTEEKLAGYFALARAMPYVQGASLLGSRLPASPLLEPLYERYYCWKYGASVGGSIDLDAACPHLLELYEVYADYCGEAVKDIFHAMVYLVPALRLGIHEAYQIAYFWERGLRVGIGDMYAMGANAPVTLAGAVTLNLAEQLALRILDWALFGEKKLSLNCSLAPLDMRTLIYPFGRPENVLANLMTAQLARFYGASFSGHGGLTSAKLPSAEAGYQKALTAVPVLLYGGSLWIDAGLLSCDEIVSPIQLVFDNEFTGAMTHLAQEVEVSPETLGIETILEAGPGGAYIDKPHTAQHFRKELWQPELWTRRMLPAWREEGSRLDVDIAREKVISILEQGAQSQISPALEEDLLSVIHAAEKESDK